MLPSKRLNIVKNQRGNQKNLILSLQYILVESEGVLEFRLLYRRIYRLYIYTYKATVVMSSCLSS